ncbi:unnamed protein product [Miscanthus lutarioriparius]|uniref:Uncharacterized protein n=1 Tax=Miscanthus lutarioriparius TaxID=422564 RepID=A0A811QF22_9POAL|nr:unnamed protein product [Miscanthus lutarioriparius]
MGAGSSTWTHHLLLLFFPVLAVATSSSHTTTINITNRCSYTVWAAACGWTQATPGCSKCPTTPKAAACGRAPVVLSTAPPATSPAITSQCPAELKVPGGCGGACESCNGSTVNSNTVFYVRMCPADVYTYATDDDGPPVDLVSLSSPPPSPTANGTSSITSSPKSKK